MRAQILQVVRNAGKAIAHPIAALQARRAEQGQSLVELSLVLPIFILLLLAAGEFGLALREQTSLTQALQQAAQYLAHHPPTSTSAACTQYLQPPYRPLASTQMDNTAYGRCSADIVTSYLKQHGFSNPSISATVTFGKNNNQQQDTVSVAYPFQVVLPLIDRINLCPSTNGNGVAYPSGSLCVAATVSVPASTESPTITNVTVGGSNTFLDPFISWTTPYNPANVNLSYNIYSCYGDLTLQPPQLSNCKYDSVPELDVTCDYSRSSTWQCYAGGAAIASPWGGCSSSGSTTTCSAQDLCNVSSNSCGTTNYAYEMTAVQPDTTDPNVDISTGIESSRSPFVYGPPFATNGP